MNKKGTDQIKLRYIAIAALAGAVFFIVLAAASLMRSTSEAKGNAGFSAAAESTAVSDDTALAVEAGEAGSGSVKTENGEAGGAPEASGASDGTLSEEGSESVSDGSADQAPSDTATAAATATVKISAAGDFTLGTDVNFDYDSSFNAYYDDYAGYPGWFLENVRQYFEDDDLTIVNFEGVLSDEGEREDKQYAFRGRPEFVEALTEGSVEACNLANNHSGDYGREAYEDTKRILANAGIQIFGYDRSVVTEVNGIKVGLTGTMELFDGMDCEESVLEEIQKVKDEGAQLIICSFHWGDEGEYHHTDIQEALAHSAIDAGADLVIGHHPHRIQEMEQYNGKYIFYSLGNFCFGGHPGPADMDTLIAQQTFTFVNGELQSAKDEDVRIIPCRISSTSEYNNYQPTAFERDSDGFARVLAKLQGDW